LVTSTGKGNHAFSANAMFDDQTKAITASAGPKRLLNDIIFRLQSLFPEEIVDFLFQFDHAQFPVYCQFIEPPFPR